MNAEDQLIDALLRQQASGRIEDEELLASIERALDRSPDGRRSKWGPAVPLSIAAGLALSAAAVMWTRRDFSPELAVNETRYPQADRIAVNQAAGTPDREEVISKGGKEVSAMRVAADNARGPGGVALAPTDPSDASMELAEGAARGAESEAEDHLSMGDTKDAEEGISAFTAAEVGAVMPLAGGMGGRSLAASKKLKHDASGGAVAGQFSGRGAAPGRTDHFSRDNHGQLVDQPWETPWEEPLSTFSVDVDKASYANLRRMIRQGRRIQPDAVRIEEMVNYFDYSYPQAKEGHPFGAGVTLATCPWNEEHLLARIAIKAEEIGKAERPASNLVFLIDVSGSMQSEDKLQLLKASMKVLVNELDERDRVGIVVYAGTEGVVLPPTTIDDEGKSKALAALAELEAGGSTNGGAGLKRAYEMALEHKVEDGVNRVILATDGDFNVGTTGQGELVSLVKERAAKGVSLSVLGFGSGNLNDAMLEAVTNDGDGNYFYIDGEREARRVFLEKLTGTLVTVAKDVKALVEFNPGKVAGYRLIGYAGRILPEQGFNDEEAGEDDVGAGHSVTAFYELVPQGVEVPAVGNVDRPRYQKPEGRGELVPSEDWLMLKLSYKKPAGGASSLIEVPVKGEPVAWDTAGLDFRFGSAVALAGMKLRNMVEVREIPWQRVVEIGKPALAEDLQEQRAEFLELVKGME